MYNSVSYRWSFFAQQFCGVSNIIFIYTFNDSTHKHFVPIDCYCWFFFLSCVCMECLILSLLEETELKQQTHHPTHNQPTTDCPIGNLPNDIEAIMMTTISSLGWLTSCAKTNLPIFASDLNLIKCIHIHILMDLWIVLVFVMCVTKVCGRKKHSGNIKVWILMYKYIFIPKNYFTRLRYWFATIAIIWLQKKSVWHFWLILSTSMFVICHYCNPSL